MNGEAGQESFSDQLPLVGQSVLKYKAADTELAVLTKLGTCLFCFPSDHTSVD